MNGWEYSLFMRLSRIEITYSYSDFSYKKLLAQREFLALKKSGVTFVTNIN